MYCFSICWDVFLVLTISPFSLETHFRLCGPFILGHNYSILLSWQEFKYKSYTQSTKWVSIRCYLLQQVAGQVSLWDVLSQPLMGSWNVGYDSYWWHKVLKWWPAIIVTTPSALWKGDQKHEISSKGKQSQCGHLASAQGMASYLKISVFYEWAQLSIRMNLQLRYFPPIPLKSDTFH